MFFSKLPQIFNATLKYVKVYKELLIENFLYIADFILLKSDFPEF